jgi:hypothetical protein
MAHMAPRQHPSGIWRRDERRIHPRARLEVPAMLDARSSHHTGRCRDVSAGGVAISTNAALPVGTIVEVYFELPNGIAVEGGAEVVRSGDVELAFRFVELPPDSRMALRGYCRLGGALASVRR